MLMFMEITMHWVHIAGLVVLIAGTGLTVYYLDIRKKKPKH